MSTEKENLMPIHRVFNPTRGRIMLHLIGLIFALLPVSFFFSSCHNNPLVGEWVYEASDRGQSLQMTYTFLKDKTYLQNGIMNGQPLPSSDGTYTQEDDIIIMKPRMSSQITKGRLKNGKLILTIRVGDAYSGHQLVDFPLTKK